MSKVVRSRLMRRVRKNPVAVAVVLVADEDLPAGGPGAEDVETTSSVQSLKEKGGKLEPPAHELSVSGFTEVERWKPAGP